MVQRRTIAIREGGTARRSVRRGMVLLAPVMMLSSLLVSAVERVPAGADSGDVVTSIPPNVVTDYNLDTNFYQKYVDAWGVPILGSANVSDAALIKARHNLLTELNTHPGFTGNSLASYKVRFVIVARNESMSSIPEVYARFGTSLDTRYWGGMGATASLPVSVGTEANLLDNQNGENVFVHESCHTIADLGLSLIDDTFQRDLEAAYSYAQKNGLFANTYAITNMKEYWAEGCQDYWDVNFAGPVGGDGSHNEIATRAQLRVYDTRLTALFDRVYQQIALTN
jgi:hypothetical protein